MNGKGKRIVTGVLAVAMCTSLVGTLAACGDSKSGDDDSNKLTIWAAGQWTGTDLQNLESFIDDYNASNTLGITVAVTPKTDLESALSTAVKSGNSPDILVWDRFNTPTYAKRGVLLDITDYIKNDNIDTTLFNDEAMSELYYNDAYYGLPLDLDVWGMYINMDMVDTYNTNHPNDQITISTDWTWDDFYNIAKKLTVFNDSGKIKIAGYAGGTMYQHYYKYLCSTTQSFLTDGQPDFDNQASRDILSFFYKMDGEGKGTIWDSGLTEKSNFTSGECAIIDQSLYFTDYIERYNPTMNYKFMPQPKYSVNGVVQEGATNGGMLGGFGLAFPLPAKKYRTESYYAKVDLAWQFTKDWLLNEDLQKKWSQEIGTLPSLKSLYTTSTVLDNETLRNAAQYVDLYKNRPQIVGYLTMQTQVIDTCIKAYTEGKATLESTINSLTVGCRDYM